MIEASKRDRRMGMPQVIHNIKSHWYLFVLGVGVFLGLAYAYTTFATKEYLVTSTMLLQNQRPPVNTSAMNNFASEIGIFSLTDDESNIKNEEIILMSRSLLKGVVKDLQLNVTVYAGSGFGSQEIFHEAPFKTSLRNTAADSVYGRIYEVEILDEQSILLSNEEEGIAKTVRFGIPVKLPQYELLLEKNAVPAEKGAIYSIEILSEEDAVSRLAGSYTVQFSGKSVTTIDMNLVYPHPEKGEVILHKIMDNYLENNLKEKVRMADSMLVFISNRLEVVAGELNDVEAKLEEYRSSNQITDIGVQSRNLIDDASDYYKMFQEKQTQLSIINQLEGYLSDPGNKTAIPSSLSIQNASFAASLAQYNTLLLEREKKSLSYTDANPVIKNLDQQIQGVRSNLLQNIASYKSELQLSTRELGSQNAAFNNKIQQIPGKERVFLDYARQQSLKQQLYMYLLQRWEEAAIARNSNMPGSRIVDDAKSTKWPVKPPKRIIYFMAFVMGLIVPLTYVNSKDVLFKRIQSELDIEKHTDVSIIGKIGRNTTSSNLVIHQESNSLIAESFRSLRTNLQFVLNFNASNVIMVTSSINGEGKTFLSWNLGSSLALAGKKVVFMELDLRKPTLSAMMGIPFDKNGYTDYVNKDLDIESIIKPTPFNENCFIVSSGPVLSNPSELLLHEKLGRLITYLRNSFDYVIIDSPPVGLVSDALIIEKFADMTIYVARHNYTNKSQIEIINELKRKTKIRNLYLVVNDINLARTGYVGYGNSYV